MASSSWLVASIPVLILVAWSVFQPTTTTHHKVLGLKRNATIAEIKHAYSQLRSPLDAKIEQAFYVLSDTYRRRDYEFFGLDTLKDTDDVQIQPIPSITPSFNYTSIKHTLTTPKPCLIQIFSVANAKSREFSPVWESLAKALGGQVDLGRIELGEIEAAKILAGKSWIRRHGVPALIAKPADCNEISCLIRYSKDLNYQTVLDWTATRLLNLPRILYFSSKNLIPDFIQKSGSHKVKAILFSDTGERALPFVREAARKYHEYASFGCVLWRPEEAHLWKSRLGIESAPALVFIKDPGLQPVIIHGELTRESFAEAVEEHKSHVLPQLRSITAAELGCDASKHSAAGKHILTWYCLVAAGKPGFQLDQLRSTMRMLQDDLADEETDNIASNTYRDKRLTLAWLDGELQKKFCYYCVASESVHETCGSRQPGEQDVPRILLIRFRREDPEKRQPAAKKHSSSWWHEEPAAEEQDLASMLIARYSGANQVSEIVSWISDTVRDGDTDQIPFFNTKSVPALVPEDQPASMLSSTGNVVSGFGRSLIEKARNFVLDIME